MSEFNCGYCGTLNTLSESRLNSRMEYSKSGILYCNTKCSGAGKKLLKLVGSIPIYNDNGLPITVSITDPVNLGDLSLFRGGLVTPEKEFGGLNKSNVEGVSTMAQTLAEFMASHPSIITTPVQELDNGDVLIKSGSPDAISSPAPVAPPVQAPAPRPVPAPANPVMPPTMAVAAPVRARRWQDDLNRNLPVGDCDAEVYPGVGKACNYDETTKTFRWSYIDQATGVLTISGNQCNRCQAKGWVSEQNLGYNYDFDVRRGKTTESWEEYKARFESIQTRTHPIFNLTTPPAVAPVAVPVPAPVVEQVVVPVQPQEAVDDNPFSD